MPSPSTGKRAPGNINMRMEYDDVAWEKSDNIFDAFKNKVTSPDVLRQVTEFTASHRGGSARPVDRARIADLGAFNLCFRMTFEDGFSSLLRFPCPGRIMFPEEKVRKEVAVMRFLRQNTKIPVPEVIAYSTRGDDSPAGLGPFILMEYVTNASNLATQLRAPGYKRGDRPILNPHIEDTKLEFFYSKVADILLELSKPSFDKIGSLTGNATSWSIDDRPLTMNMNELVQLGNFPRSKLPSSTFDTASSYYQTLAETHFMHRATQRNDAVESEKDGFRKYVARRLFCKLASASRLGDSNTSDSGPFKLFCDDLRPTNILLDENMKIVAVIDWEFTYAALAEFTYSPPWWLLLEMPEEWPRGIADWIATYQPRLETFFRVLKAREDAAICSGTLTEAQRLSGRMREGWENGEFWVNYGARKSWAFDTVWPMIDMIFYGGEDPCASLEERTALLCSEKGMTLLSDQEKEEMKDLIRRKLEDRKHRKLNDWDAA